MADTIIQLVDIEGNRVPVKATDLGDGTYALKVDTELSGSSGLATEAKQDAAATLTGAVTETAPASDTASSGLNGRLQRIAQRITSLIALIPAALDTGQSTSPEAGRLKVAVTLAQRVKFANIQIAAGAADVVYTLSFSKLDADGQRVVTTSGPVTGTLSTANDSKTLADLFGASVPADAVEAYLSIDKEARILNSSSTVVAANRLTLMHTLPAGGLYPLTSLF